jgi:hypothetical protein
VPRLVTGAGAPLRAAAPLAAEPRAVEVPKRFRKRLHKKPPEMQGAIAQCIYQLTTSLTHSGLSVHKMSGFQAVYEAYIDRSNRITFEFGDDGRIVLLNHCNHDVLRRPA